jgi:hypothetical protein
MPNGMVPFLFIDLTVVKNGKFCLKFRQNLANIWKGICVATNKYAYVHSRTSTPLTEGVVTDACWLINTFLA